VTNYNQPVLTKNVTVECDDPSENTHIDNYPSVEAQDLQHALQELCTVYQYFYRFGKLVFLTTRYIATGQSYKVF